jgi:cytochrome c oxidase assembly protein subunit 15
MQKRFPKIVTAAIISIYLIFLAGSVVRMTGSGMGCPDWPKCFGYLIPPTAEEQILWKPNTSFKEGSIIVISEELYVAQHDVLTGSEFNPTKWENIQSTTTLFLMYSILGRNILIDWFLY